MAGRAMSDAPHLLAVAPPAFPANVDREADAVLAKMLRDAEAGRLRALAVAAIVICDDGAKGSRTAFIAPTGHDCEWMIGALEVAKHRLMTHSIDLATQPHDWPEAPESA